MFKVFIIAEAGVNHNGSVQTAQKMIDAAADAGADAVKFQTFNAQALAAMSAKKAAYQRRTTGRAGTQLEMLKRLELGHNAHLILIRHCRKRGIKFLSSPFDLASVELLDKLGLGIFKIPSGEITNYPYLAKIGRLKKKIILSTGMSGQKDIEAALGALTKAGAKKEDITVLHCNSDYPTRFEDVNLTAMLTIRDKFKIRVGYSDHTPGIAVPIAAAALGASVIEKHFTLNRNMRGPDHKASLEPAELKDMVRAIRNVEAALGDGVKRPSQAELRNRPAGRKSIVASKAIMKGDIFSEANITTKRPGTGISPMAWNRVIGKAAKRPFRKDELIKI